jgi:hypothetical protein
MAHVSASTTAPGTGYVRGHHLTNRKPEASDSNTAGNTVKDPEAWVTGDEKMNLPYTALKHDALSL